MALDKKNKPIRPAKLWCDTSTAEQCKQFEEEFGGPRGLIKLAGNAMLPGYTAPKILWLKQNEPKNYKALQTVLLPHDYINLYLTGERGMEFGDASGTGLLDVREKKWCEPLIDFIDPDLPRPCRRWPAPARLRPAARKSARGMGTSKGEVTVSAGGGDNMMGAIGTGNVQPGVVTVSLGTSGTVYAFAEKPVIDPQGEVAAFCDSTDRWLPLVCTMNVTVATEQVRKMFGWDRTRNWNPTCARRPPGAEGLLFLPYLNGERTPNLPNGSGVFHGLTTENMTPAHLARATMEGVTLGLAYGLRPLSRAWHPADGNPAHRRRQQERGLAANGRGYLRRPDDRPRLRGRRGARRGDPGRMGAREHHRKTHLAGDDCEPHYKA